MGLLYKDEHFEKYNIIEKMMNYIQTTEHDTYGFYVKDSMIALDFHINDWVSDGNLIKADMTEEEALSYYFEENEDEIFDKFLYVFYNLVTDFEASLTDDEILRDQDILPSEFYDHIINYGYGFNFKKSITFKEEE